MLEHVCNFQPFVDYGAHQVIGKFYFELEKKRNPLFAQFVEETERKPESRRLELNGYLTKPTTRLGRYNLLLREILKSTPDDNPDKETIPQIMAIITKYLTQVNIEAGKCENAFNLKQIGDRLEFKTPSDYVVKWILFLFFMDVCTLLIIAFNIGLKIRETRSSVINEG